MCQLWIILHFLLPCMCFRVNDFDDFVKLKYFHYSKIKLVTINFAFSSWKYMKYAQKPLEVFYKKDVLKNFAKFTCKHLDQRLLFNKAAGLRPATVLKKGLWHRCFPMNYVKFLLFYRTPLGDCFCFFDKLIKINPKWDV